jgi:RHS repeat-associated protein
LETDAGTPASRTEYGYDYLAETASINHSGPYNLTSEMRWDSTKGAYSNPLTSSNSITISHTYGPNGTLSSTTDGIGTVTQYTYGTVSGWTNVCPTQRVDGYGITSLERTTTFTPDFWTCLSTSTTDVENGNVTATSYDPFGRMTNRIEAQGRPEQRTTSVTYQDGCDGNWTSCFYAFVRSDLNSGDGALTWVYRYDDLGRPRLTQQMEAPQGSVPNETVGIKVQTRHIEQGGQYRLVSNPFRASVSTAATSESTMGWTLTGYDTMGRVSAVRDFGSATAPAWTQTTGGSGATTTVYSASTATNTFGSLVTVTDPAGKQKETVTDGLGRLTNVIEDPSGLNYATAYSYDALDDLLSVNQSSESRGFAYDSLGRLSSAVNPESGTTCYGTINASTGACQPAGGYDGNGNLLTKSFKVASAQGGGYTSALVTQVYDNLNRLIQKSYSDGTPNVSMCYDGNATAVSSTGSPSVTCTGAPSLSGVNARGRLTWATNANSTNSYSDFDSFGRVLAHSQITSGATYGFSYGYNEVGLNMETYPSGRTLVQGYDGAGRVSSLSGTQYYTAANSSILYTAHGAVTSIPLPMSLTEQTCYNSRLQPFGVQLSSVPTTNCTNSGNDALNLLLAYGAVQDNTGNVTSSDDNGNVLRQQITRAGQATLTQSYTGTPYDGVNRLVSATETGGSSEWNQTYGYDAYGNRWVTGGTTLSTFTPTTATNYPSNNQLSIQGSSYDAAGNQTAIGGYTFQYDGENRQTYGGIGGNIATYSYDGEGRRVEKVAGGDTTVYVYDTMGQLTAEYSASAPALCQTCYLTVDPLGSTRQETDGRSGQAVACHDFLPFGEEIPGGYGSRTAVCFNQAGPMTDPTAQRFTGKERDAELAGSAMQGLDYFGARYFSGAQGRFTSPDDFRNDSATQNPQSWNLYSYGRNNPLRYTDPDGQAVNVCLNDENGKQTCTVMSDPDYAAAIAGNNPGVNAPAAGANAGPGGGLAVGGAITCGGAVCGSATYQEESMQDTSADLLITLQVGRDIGAGIVGLGQSMFRAGVRLFAREAGSAAAKAAPDLANLSPKILKDMVKRGWTKQEIQDAVQFGKAEPATDFTAGGAPATRYTNPTTGKAVTINDATGKVIQVGDVGFRYDVYNPKP